jgi:hypothetical protein
MTPVHTEFFHSDGRGPELVALRWGFSGRVLEAAEFMLPDAAAPGDLRHVRFLRPQVVMRTPEEVIDYREFGSQFAKHRPAAMFDLGKSKWLKSFSQRHLERCTHYQLYFYDELLDVIAEGVAFGAGPYRKEEPIQPPQTTTGSSAPDRV